MGRQGRKLRVKTCSALARPLLFIITAKRKQGGFVFSAYRFIYTNTKNSPDAKIAPGVCYSNFKVLKSNTASRLSVNMFSVIFEFYAAAVGRDIKLF